MSKRHGHSERSRSVARAKKAPAPEVKPAATAAEEPDETPRSILEELGQPAHQATPVDVGEVSELDDGPLAGDFGDGFADGFEDESDDPDAEDREEDEPVERSLNWLRIIVACVAVLALVITAGAVVDGIARLAAERTIAGELQKQLGKDAHTQVMIGGSPFLAQAAKHQYPVVRVRAPGATIDGLRFSKLNIDAKNVKTTEDNKSGTIEGLTGDGVITYESISTAQGMPMKYVSPTQLQITYPGKVLGFDLKVIVTGEPVLDVAAQNVSLTNIHTKVEGVALSDLVVGQAAKMLVKPVPLPMPAGMKVTKVQLLPEGLSATVSGSNVDLAGFH